MFKIEDNVWSLEDYLEEICGSRLIVADLDEFEAIFGGNIWNYPISEIEHCVEIGGEYAVVAFPDPFGGYEHRICEIKELSEDFEIERDDETDY